MIDELTGWYQAHARPLPWREAPTPYHVWVSEVMLQQTRIEAVLRYYDRFLKALPDVNALAESREEDLLKLWEGLGYYNRARSMQKAAKIIKEQYHGEIPGTFDELIELPGFGPYTAGAVASICFHQPVSAVDGNVLRVLSRILDDHTDVLSTAARKKAVEYIEPLLLKTDPAVLNQAIMELGETICIPNASPYCERCPLRPECIAYAKGTQNQLPVRLKKIKRKTEKKTVLIIRDTLHTVVRKRPSDGLLANMYEPPVLDGWCTADDAVRWLAEQGFSPLRIQALPEAKHIFSHIEWKMHGFLVLTEDMEEDLLGLSDEYSIVKPSSLQEKYPVPGAFAAYSEWMKIKIGVDRLKYGENNE